MDDFLRPVRVSSTLCTALHWQKVDCGRSLVFHSWYAAVDCMVVRIQVRNWLLDSPAGWAEHWFNLGFLLMLQTLIDYIILVCHKFAGTSVFRACTLTAFGFSSRSKQGTFAAAQILKGSRPKTSLYLGNISSSSGERLQWCCRILTHWGFLEVRPFWTQVHSSWAQGTSRTVYQSYSLSGDIKKIATYFSSARLNFN